MIYTWLLGIGASIAGIYTALAKTYRFGPFLDEVKPDTSTDGGTVYTPIPIPPSPTQKIYDVAKASLGKKMNPNPAVLPEVACATSLSAVLALAGYILPSKGITTVKGMIVWLLANGFKEVIIPSAGCVITASGNPNYSHCGVVMKWGVASNDSRPEHLGRWIENYPSVAGWERFFTSKGSKTRYFVPL